MGLFGDAEAVKRGRVCCCTLVSLRYDRRDSMSAADSILIESEGYKLIIFPQKIVFLRRALVVSPHESIPFEIHFQVVL